MNKSAARRDLELMSELRKLRDDNAALLEACKTAEWLLLDGVGREKVRTAIAKAEGKW